MKLNWHEDEIEIVSVFLKEKPYKNLGTQCGSHEPYSGL
jgi:hypothetical protein